MGGFAICDLPTAFTVPVICGYDPAPRRAPAHLLGQRSNQGNRVPVVAPVKLEVTIGGANLGVTMDFSQTHDASIRKIHRGIGALVQQPAKPGQFTR